MQLSRRRLIGLSFLGAATALTACSGTPLQSVGSKADGRILFAVNGSGDPKKDGIYFITDGGANPKKILGKDAGIYALQYPRWSPDGQRVAFVRVGDRGIYADLWTTKADGTDQRQLTDFRSKLQYGTDIGLEKQYTIQSSVIAGVSWSKADFLSFASDRNAPQQTKQESDPMRLWFAEDSSARPGDPHTRVVPATASINFQVDNTALSPDGKFAAFSASPTTASGNSRPQIQLLNIDARKWVQLTDALPEGTYDPTFSPDSRYIAFVGRPAFRVNDIYIGTANGQNPPQKITDNGVARAPVFSPDGRKLAFLSNVESGQFVIYVMDVTLPADISSPVAFGKPDKVFDGMEWIDARSGLSWSA